MIQLLLPTVSSGVTIKSDKVLNFKERYFTLSPGCKEKMQFDRFIPKDT